MLRCELMPVEIKPVIPRVTDQREYERLMRRVYLRPTFQAMTYGLALASSVSTILSLLRNGTWVHVVPTVKIRESASSHVRAINKWHRARFHETFKQAGVSTGRRQFFEIGSDGYVDLGIDIGPTLNEPQIAAYLRQVVVDQRVLDFIPRPSGARGYGNNHSAGSCPRAF